MPPIYFVTGNKDKFQIATNICNDAMIKVEQVNLDIDEIQGEDPRQIIKHKAHSAFKLHGKPIVVSDDSWDIPALNGFPGAYMKSINHWFKPEDFLRLMHGISDRTIHLHAYLAFYNGSEYEVFTTTFTGELLTEAHGNHDKSPNMTITTLEGDNGMSLAEVYEQPSEFLAHRFKNRREVWHELAKWYKEKHS